MNKQALYVFLAFLFVSLPIISGGSGFFSVTVKAEEQPSETPPESEEKKEDSEEEIVHLQSRMTLMDLIQAVSEITKETYLVDDSVKGKKVTIVTPEGGLKKKDVVKLFETILTLNGFTLVEDNNVNKIIPKGEIKRAATPVVVGE